MDDFISTKEKQIFLNWFLNNYRLKKRETFWILNHLLHHPETLTYVHFVHDLTYCPRGLLITSVCSNKTAFLFYKSQLVTTDTDKAFHDIRLNNNEPLYIQLDFNNANQNIWLAGILEENPYLKHEHIITIEDEKNASRLLDTTLHAHQKQTLLKHIDHALDKKDKQLFNDLVNQLHILNSSHNITPILLQ